MKRLSRQGLDSIGWQRISIGSSVVTFCDKCGVQRTHVCISKEWDDDDYVFEFSCNSCGDSE